MLLVIGWIEQHPGPTTPTDQETPEEPTRIMAALGAIITDAPGPFKLYLAAWSDTKSSERNKADLNKAVKTSAESRTFLAWLWSVPEENEDIAKITTKKMMSFYNALWRLKTFILKNARNVKFGTPLSEVWTLLPRDHPGCVTEYMDSINLLRAGLSGRLVWLCPGCQIHQCSSSTVGGRKGGRKKKPVVANLAAPVPQHQHVPQAPPPPADPAADLAVVQDQAMGGDVGEECLTKGTL